MIEDNILLFEARTESGLNLLKPCQGLRVSGRHIATSPGCAELVRRNISSHPILIKKPHSKESYEIENLTDNFYFDALSRVGSYLLLPIKGGQITSDSEVFFDMQQNPQHSEIKVIFIDENGRSEIDPITLAPVNNEDSERVYKILSLATFPSGSIVVNNNDEIICFIGSANLCFKPDFSFNLSGRTKRSSENVCQVKHFQCSNASFTTCLPNGNGEGECTNDHTGERCSLGTYPNGFQASYQGQNLFCNDPDGCEAIVCPTSCASGYSSCSCQAVYKLNDLTHTIPCNCISFSNSSIPCGNQPPGGGGGHKGLTHTQTTAIGLAVPIGVVVTVVAVVFVVYYYVTNKRARSNPLGRGALISNENL